MASEITSHVWYDASEGGDEFFLDVNDASQTDEPLEYRHSDVEEEEEAEVVADEGSDDEPVVEIAPIAAKSDVMTVRRTRLPSPNNGEEGSLFAVLKKNVGKVSHFSSGGYNLY